MIYDGYELPPFEIWVAKVVIRLIANFYAGGSLYYNNFIISLFSCKITFPHTALKEVDSNLLKALASHSENYGQINV